MTKNYFEYEGLSTKEGKLLFIAGPCVIENESITLRIAETLKEIADELNIQLVFKASYDKANRTSLNSFRGPGIDAGLKILQKVKDEFSLPVLSDIHEKKEAFIVKDVLDIIQIPAFLSRQTDLLRFACETGKAVNVKKGQFLTGADMEYVFEKCFDAGKEKRLLFTERGNSFGYNNLVVDMKNIPLMRRFAPVVFDATHSVQMPSSNAGVSGGAREFIPTLLFSALGCNIDGVFMEVHPEPENALSDSATMFPLSHIRDLWKRALEINELIKGE